MIKIILMDADGVLIRKESDFLQRFSKDQDIEPRQVEDFFRNEWHQIVTGRADLKEVLKEYMPRWGWLKSIEDLLVYWFISEKDVDKRITLSVKNLSKQGIDCYLATNQEKYRLEHLSEVMKFKSLFKRIYSSCDLGVRKPNREFFDLIWNDLGCPPKNQILFWDDSKSNILSARKYGFHAHHYSSYQDFRQIMEARYDLSV